METARYLSLANGLGAADQSAYKRSIKINLVTNFTDQVLQRFIVALCLENGIYPDLFVVPYKQYDFLLANQSSELYSRNAEVTFIFFDANVYNHSPFTDESGHHFSELLPNLKAFAASQKGMVICNTFQTPYHSQYGNLFTHNRLFQQVESYNEMLVALSKDCSNVHLHDINRVISVMGEKQARNLRGLYAFDMPFSNEFLLLVAKEWFSYILVLTGKMKKCIVVDLDNTLWGGVVGELGAKNIELGPQYPGLAFQNFQRALLECYQRGLLLAVVSKNNEADVDEVFAQNEHMVLKKEHFAATRINWELKTTNLLAIAKELNIGLDSLVFIDDDPVNRELVRETLPEVMVPEFSLPPEAYVDVLFSLPIYNQFKLTSEDREKGAMYTQEKQRKVVETSAVNLDDYISRLGLKMEISCNQTEQVERLSQLSLKTNQFNLTTKRYTEAAIKEYMNSAWVYSGDVHDKFGAYGITIMAIVTKTADATVVELDTYLMSCRVMGRGVEQAFLGHIIADLRNKGVRTISAAFIPTAKNVPAKGFLEQVGFTKVQDDKDGRMSYTMAVDTSVIDSRKAGQAIEILLHK